MERSLDAPVGRQPFIEEMQVAISENVSVLELAKYYHHLKMNEKKNSVSNQVISLSCHWQNNVN